MKRPPAAMLSEANLRSQAARTLLQLFDSLYEGAIAVDAEARIVWMNDKYKALLGWNGTEPLEGRPVEEIIPDSRMRQVVESGRAELLDVFTANGRQLVVSRIPLFDDAGAIVGGLGVILYDRLQALKPIVSKFQRMQDDLALARKQLAEGRQAKYSFTQFIGTSPAVRELKSQARRAAERDATVLLLGETGTGKELLAHAIHAASPRAPMPMVRINAAAIPETLLEAELFGAVPGAYTGAGPKPRLGKIQMADRGTLFLDEVGDMPLGLQAKLLRVLQEKEIEPLGSSKLISVDVRIIAATSRNLKQMVEAGQFRADLYYRLNVLPLNLPPLRERASDLALLCEAILEGMAAETGGSVRELTAEALAALARHSWPGNVRELRNALEQAAARSDARLLQAQDFACIIPTVADPPLAANPDPDVPMRSLRETMAAAERSAILQALAGAQGVRSQAAKLLGISRAQFYEKLAAHGLLSPGSDTRRVV